MHESANLGATCIIMCDFNQSSLKAVQIGVVLNHILSACGMSSQEREYTRPPIYHKKRSVSFVAATPPGDLEHMVHLVPAYRQQLKREKLIENLMPQLTKSVIQSLQSCYAWSDWHAFRSDNRRVHRGRYWPYKNFCKHLCIPEKLRIYPNGKPLFGKSIRHELMNKEIAHPASPDGQSPYSSA